MQLDTLVWFGRVEPSRNNRYPRWHVYNSGSNFHIGYLIFNKSWRRLVFEPSINCIYDTDVLTEIVLFMNQQAPLIEEIKRNVEKVNNG